MTNSITQLAKLPPKQALLLLLREKARRVSQRFIETLYPDKGPLRRALYKKHLLFFRLGAKVRARCFMAANRIGKTMGTGGYELVRHLTGVYPDWWEGRRFDKPVSAWAAGDTRQTVRDILQNKLLGQYGKFGTGLIPGDRILKWTPKSGVPEAVESVHVKHERGTSILTFKSYDQGREAFQGTEQDVILLDEESDEGIRNECLLRLMTTNGILMETFTPLKGLTPAVMQYLPKGHTAGEDTVVDEAKSSALIMAGWDDVPHLDAKVKAEILANTPPHLKDARSKGIPSLGAGAIYPIPESEILVDPIEIPKHWPRAYGLDVGWNKTAGLWGAYDAENDTWYLYAEHYRGQAEPSVHAAAVRARGTWIPGAIDPAARGRGQKDGEQLLQNYRDLGLELYEADNAVEAGLFDCYERLSTGRVKVFRTLVNFMTEYRLYRRDEKGRIVKAMDHLMDAMRYLIRSGQTIMETQAESEYETHSTRAAQERGRTRTGY